jgi:3-dehydroquinate dehydratase/shikimate dehydrogenase
MVQVVVPIAAAEAAAVRTLAAQAKAEGADAVELRLDTCARLARGHGALSAIVAAIPQLGLPVLATVRHASEGGDWDGSETERQALLWATDQAGATWIDIELAHFSVRQRPTRAKLILSHHDFAGMGGDLIAVIARMRALRCDIAKIAVMPGDAADLAVIEALYQRADGPLVAIAMGERGLPSRLLAGAWGAAMTFARLSDAPGSAPGQPTARDLVDRYRIHRQGPRTHVFGVIGNPIAHSLSPLIHNTAFAHHGLDAVYVPFLVDDAPAFWAACGGWIDGLSITIPHKHALLDRVDRLEPLAQRIGAMNTIYRDERNASVGANTDASAAVACIEAQAASLVGRRVIILGAGGVSRAIAFAVAERGARVTIANRGQDRAQELATEVGGEACALEHAPQLPFDVLINGTSVGMGSRDRPSPSESPWPRAAHRRDSVVFDTVYTPLETALIKDAQMAGATTVCGLSMFIGQALGQFSRWTGREAPEGLLYRLALERLGGRVDPGRSASSSASTSTQPARKSTVNLEQTLGGGV